MDFSKENEKLSFRVGKPIGFLFSYLLFFSIFFFVLPRLGLSIPVNYFIFVGIFLVLYLIYAFIKKYLIKKVKRQ